MEFIEKLLASLREDVNADEIKAGLESHIKIKVEEEMPKLKEAKDTILTEKKTIQKELKLLKDSVKWIEDNEMDAEKFKELMQKMETLEATNSTSSADIATIKQEMFDSGKKVKANELQPLLDKAIEGQKLNLDKANDYQGKYIEYQKEILLNNVFDKLHIDNNPFTRRGIKSYAKTDFNDMDDKLTITMYDPSQDKHIPLSDWVTSFPNTDEGKSIIKVPASTGGGAKGGAGTGSEDGPIENIFTGMFPDENVAK